MAASARVASVHVCARFRPTAKGADLAVELDPREKTVLVRNVRDSRTGRSERDVEETRFALNELLRPEAAQDEVFRLVAEDVVEGALEGFNGTVLAYGQTGSGKTFTMTGGATARFADRGLVPRSIGHLFRRIKEEIAARPTEAPTTVVRVSYMEIYNEQIFDLLASVDAPARTTARPARPDGDDGEAEEDGEPDRRGAAVKGGAPAGAAGGADSLVGVGRTTAARRFQASRHLAVIEDRHGRTHVRGLTRPVVTSEEEALQWLFEGETNRAVAEHALNDASTRSHCVFTVYLERRKRRRRSPLRGRGEQAKRPPRADGPRGLRISDGKGEGGSGSGEEGGEGDTGSESGSGSDLEEEEVRSKLHLVDLAGSERLSKTGSVGETAEEAKYINKSLTFLEQVVLALVEKGRGHVPYRSSKLTNVLKDSLGGNCRTRLIACVRPDAEHLSETMATLRFACRMMRVKTAPVRNAFRRDAHTHGWVYGEGGLGTGDGVGGAGGAAGAGVAPAVVAALRAELQRAEAEVATLRRELALHDMVSGKPGVKHRPLTEGERTVVAALVDDFLRGGAGASSSSSSEEESSRAGGAWKALATPADRLFARLPTVRHVVSALELLRLQVEEATRAGGGGGGGGRGGSDAGGNARGGGDAGLKSAGRRAEAGDEGGGEVLEERGSRGERTAVSSSSSLSSSSSSPSSSTATTPPPPLDRAAALEEWKVGPGQRWTAELAEGVEALRDRKGAVRTLAATVNEAKAAIDALVTQLESASSRGGATEDEDGGDESGEARDGDGDGDGDGGGAGGARVRAKEAREALARDLSTAKRDYRLAYARWQDAKAEVAYLTRAVEQLRTRIADGFEAWFEDRVAVRGGAHAGKVSRDAGATASTQGEGDRAGGERGSRGGRSGLDDAGAAGGGSGGAGTVALVESHDEPEGGKGTRKGRSVAREEAESRSGTGAEKGAETESVAGDEGLSEDAYHAARQQVRQRVRERTDRVAHALPSQLSSASADVRSVSARDRPPSTGSSKSGTGPTRGTAR